MTNLFTRIFSKKNSDNNTEKEVQILNDTKRSNDRFSIQVDRNLNGQRLENCDKIEDAIEEYEKNINENFEGNHPYDRLAILYRKNKDYENEIRVLKKGVKLFSELLKSSRRADLKPKLEKFKERLEKSMELKKFNKI